jgi:hypothetical protein
VVLGSTAATFQKGKAEIALTEAANWGARESQKAQGAAGGGLRVSGSCVSGVVDDGEMVFQTVYTYSGFDD